MKHTHEKTHKTPEDLRRAIQDSPEEESINEIAKRLDVTWHTVQRWRNRDSTDDKERDLQKHRTSAKERIAIRNSTEDIATIAKNQGVTWRTAKRWKKEREDTQNRLNQRVTFAIAKAIQDRPGSQRQKAKILDVNRSTIQIWSHRNLSDYFTENSKDDARILPKNAEEEDVIILRIWKILKPDMCTTYEWAHTFIPTLAMKDLPGRLLRIAKKSAVKKGTHELHETFTAAQEKNSPAKTTTQKPMPVSNTLRRKALETFGRLNDEPAKLLNFFSKSYLTAIRMLNALVTSDEESRKLALEVLFVKNAPQRIVLHGAQMRFIELLENLVRHNDPTSAQAILNLPDMARLLSHNAKTETRVEHLEKAIERALKAKAAHPAPGRD